MVHEKWGSKWVCFGCGCKFYDLKKSSAVCPKCGADQGDRPKHKEDLPEDEEENAADDSGAELTEEERIAATADDDLPPMQEELGYDETDEEE